MASAQSRSQSPQQSPVQDDSLESSIVSSQTAGHVSRAAAAMPDSMTMTILHSLFAVAFAALTLGIMSCLGFVVRTSTACPACHGYSRCAMWQDLRSVASFVLGALLCSLLTRGRQDTTAQSLPSPEEMPVEKVQLYAYMM
mmetsp:Transcript_22563/g.40872  ORF Transcript_22563/g.40872 Transcript_22563/m.40872 type:complete len:141 (-) Transcript_22563:65-487(-)